MPERPWTGAMMNAWQWARRAVNEGLSGAAGLRAFREGGGSIRTQDWYSLMHWAQEASMAPEEEEEYMSDVSLPQSVYPPTPFDLREPYKMIAEVEFVNPQTGERDTITVSCLDTDTKSLDMWDAHLDVVLSNYGLSLETEGVSVKHRWFYRRA